MNASNSTEPGPVSTVAGAVAYYFFIFQPYLPLYTHLICSALFPIYTGAHASLSRPSSAGKPEKTKSPKKKSGRAEEDSDSDDLEEDEDATSQMEGLSPSDALWFPIAAGSSLAGLYFLIKWLGDAVILNKVLNAYFALFSVFSVMRLVSDALGVVTDITFPRLYSDAGAIWRAKTPERTFAMDGESGTVAAERKSPFPSVFGRLPMPIALSNYFWGIREVLTGRLHIKFYAYKMGTSTVRMGLNSIVGFIVGVGVVLYFNLVQKPWFLTNLMGVGFAYGAMQLLTPTTFATGSLVLGALFFYDIYFVFYTPMMVAVAQSLDIPIKLVFPRPQLDPEKPPSEAMLGLGDVVLPGIMIGLALRFDHYMYYLRKQKKIPIETGDSENTDYRIEKVPFKKTSSTWASHFWSHSWIGYLVPYFTNDTQGDLSSFPKPYFRASLVGYVAGLVTTIGIMHIFKHAQPALLYLVPGVLSSIWLTALVRGEISEMWHFQDGFEEEEEQDSDKDKDGDAATAVDGKGPSSVSSSESKKASDSTSAEKSHSGKSEKSELSQSNGLDGDENKTSSESDNTREKREKKNSGKRDDRKSRSNRELIRITILAPRHSKHEATKDSQDGKLVGENSNKLRPKKKSENLRNDCGIGDGEPAEKRVKLN